MKRGFIVFAAALAILLNTAGNVCQAAILPRHGAGQSGFSAVVLCEALTVRQEADAGSKAVGTLSYGKQFAMMEKADGWAKCVLSDDVDASPAGWVNANYIVIDPKWYRTDQTTPVYAWNDTQAKKVALLEKDTTLPIVKEEGDWLVVSLRGGVGWIHKTAADKEAGEQTDEPSDSPAEKPSENPTDTTDKIDKSDKSEDESSDPDTISVGGGSYELSDQGTATFLKPVKSAKTFEVPDTIEANGKSYKVTAIGAKAFYKNKKLTKITIGKNVSTIGKNAFARCAKLTSVTLGSSVTTIGDNAFYKCTALAKITIPSKVTKIGKNAFRSCGKLKSITIKTKKLQEKKVGSKAFTGTAEKATVKVPKKSLTAYKKWLVKKGISSKAKIKR